VDFFPAPDWAGGLGGNKGAPQNLPDPGSRQRMAGPPFQLEIDSNLTGETGLPIACFPKNAKLSDPGGPPPVQVCRASGPCLFQRPRHSDPTVQRNPSWKKSSRAVMGGAHRLRVGFLCCLWFGLRIECWTPPSTCRQKGYGRLKCTRRRGGSFLAAAISRSFSGWVGPDLGYFPLPRTLLISAGEPGHAFGLEPSVGIVAKNRQARFETGGRLSSLHGKVAWPDFPVVVSAERRTMDLHRFLGGGNMGWLNLRRYFFRAGARFLSAH